MSALKSRTAPGDTLPRSAILLSTPGSKRWPWSRNALVVAHYLVNVRIDLRMKDKPHQLRRLWIRGSSSSNDMPRDGFAPNSISRRRASATPSSSSCRTDGSDPSRCAARTALSVSGKSSASFSTSAMVAIQRKSSFNGLEGKDSSENRNLSRLRSDATSAGCQSSLGRGRQTAKSVCLQHESVVSGLGRPRPFSNHDDHRFAQVLTAQQAILRRV
jgi:hypothetical protein